MHSSLMWFWQNRALYLTIDNWKFQMNNEIYTSPMKNNSSVVYVNSSLNSYPSDQPIDLTWKVKTRNKQVYEHVSTSRENDHFGNLQHVGNTHIIAAQGSSNVDKTDKDPILRALLNKPAAPPPHRMQAHHTVQPVSYGYGENAVTQNGIIMLKP